MILCIKDFTGCLSLAHALFQLQNDHQATAKPCLLARARYNNVAESPDELSFRQGDIVTVREKDHNQQMDWWLCELRGKVGMVPANYFEIFHDHDSQPLYDTPKSARTTPRTTPTPTRFVPSPRPHEDPDGPLYDFPPELNLDTGEGDRDYDMPPSEGPNADYDRPPSSNRSSVKSSNLSFKINRLSGASGSSNASASLYDFPPDPSDVYNFPKSTPAKAVEDEAPLAAMETNTMYDDEAQELLSNYQQDISATYEQLFQNVYGPDAYWGSDNKPQRSSTLQRTIKATKRFDRAITVLLEFGKGVLYALESSSDTNFKRKYMSAFRALLEKRREILLKLDSLSSEVESITATVKSLLEVARTVPSAVTEFTVLVQANKALVFKVRAPDESLPVITRNDVKSRPLPELPTPMAGNPNRESDTYDYALITTPTSKQPNGNVPSCVPLPNGRVSPVDNGVSLESSLDFGSRRRNPNDVLPPLPYATVPRPAKSHKKAQSPQTTPIRPRSPVVSSKADLILGGRGSPSLRTRAEQIDFDNIDAHSGPAPIRSNRPSTGSGASRGASPLHRVRRQSLGSASNSSDEANSSGGGPGFRRVNSSELLDTPYGRPAIPNGFPPRSSSPQPLRQEDRELLQRFTKQMDLVVPSLREAVDVFLDCLKDSEPPKDFVTKSKLAVVAAYKLVYIADALSQKIYHPDTRSAILASSNHLTEGIKELVSDTKTAALQYPSVIALQKMGVSLRKLFPAALDLVNSVKSRATLV